MNNENNQNNNHGENSNEKKSDGGFMGRYKAGMCGGSCGCGHSHMHLLRWLIKIIILAIIFCFAFRMGEVRGMLGARGFDGGNYRYGNRSMMYYGYGNGYYAPGAMQGNVQIDGATTPSTTAQ